MLKTSRLFFPVIAIIALFSGIYFIRAIDDVLLTGSYGEPHVTGVYNTGGNAGVISFDVTPGGYS
jgi:hypothetical protein